MKSQSNNNKNYYLRAISYLAHIICPCIAIEKRKEKKRIEIIINEISIVHILYFNLWKCVDKSYTLAYI